MSKKHIFLSIVSKITVFACVFCVFFISPVFATLPAGYTELEYIESTGTQYIDTGVANNSLTDPTVEITLKMIDIADTTWFGVSTADAKGIFYNIKTASPERWYARWGSQSYSDRPLTYQPGKSVLDLVFTDALHTVKLTGTTNLSVYVDGELVGTNTYNSCAFTATGNICLFGVQTSPTKRKMQLGMWKISNNDTLLQHLIPVKRNSDGEIGMYDMVTNTFFTNQGTGDFIAGPIAHCKTFGTNGVTCTECETDYILNNVGGCSEKIKIATTKMVDDEFAATEAKLATTVQTIESVVSRTITQTGQIQVLQDTKQTRPDESCPANMKCLLVQDEDGTPHWYPIIEP
ncbi:MAG: hypothetical protein MJ164_00400 [Alphaproteobacteria bacterium]|nr:hypothetical protein [Alphaproteobacteria bacterium]